MRVCRFKHDGKISLGFYRDDKVVDLEALYRCYLKSKEGKSLWSLEPFPSSLLEILPPNNGYYAVKVLEVFHQKTSKEKLSKEEVVLNVNDVKLLTPVPNPPKFLLVSGNYAEHVEEYGEVVEKSKTFPYFFMKPSTTIINPGDPIKLPSISPDYIDWEAELGVIVGRRVKGISAKDALRVVAGYTIVNDISDRNFKPNPKGRRRPEDEFFDWLHGKWHDTFAPIGPCITSRDQIPNVQNLQISLRVNNEIMQNSNTSRMIFSVAEIIEFISSFVTLEPGDIISTGTPGGVGFARGRFLRSGDVVDVMIERIGVLRNPVA